jgi:small-conductance mechanosensitive channel
MWSLFDKLLLEFQAQIVSIVPGLLFGVVFLTVAYCSIWFVRSVLTTSLKRFYKSDEKLIGTLIVNLTSVGLWFGTLLILFNILGMGNIAASLGTASGFAALGFSFALSNVIADIVAGVYLIQDPDFCYGDRISTGSVTGTVQSVELRKSRIKTDEGETVILANSEVEKKWTRVPKPEEKPAGDTPESTDGSRSNE